MEAGKLIVQRDSVLDKLKKLEIMKSQIRDIVYNKIKEEYAEQLKDINSKLEKEKDYLKEEINRIKSLEAETLLSIETVDIQIEELNVRFTLNEFTEEEYSRKKSSIEQDMNEKRTRLKELKDKRRTLEDITGKENEIAEPKGITAPSAVVLENVIAEPLVEEKIGAFEQTADESQPIEIRSFDNIIPDTALVPPAEEDPSNFKEITIEDKIPEVKESSIDNIISNDILKEETFSLGEDVSKDEKLVNENPLEAAKGQKDDDLNEFAKLLDNQITPLDSGIQDQSGENIEGLTCPKCGHLNKSDLFNCEKCGAELL